MFVFTVVGRMISDCIQAILEAKSLVAMCSLNL